MRYLFVLMVILFFTAGCTTLEVGIETIPPPTQTPAASPTQTPAASPPETAEPDTPAPIPTETQPELIDINNRFPELVTIAHLAPYSTGDFGVLVLDDEELSVQPSPVSFQIFWEYTPVTGRLAYSPEFVHGSDHNNVSVSSLWVYDYETGEASMWLEDNVIRAGWSPDGERVTAALYNPDTEQIDLVFVSGPDEVEPIAECASNLFSWSPDGNQLVYVNAISWAGVNQACSGTYLVSFPDGLTDGEPQIERVSDFGSQELLSGHQSDQPIWALEEQALIYPDQPFWIVPLDGSPAFIPSTPQGEDPLEVPRPANGLWSAELKQLSGNYDSGLSGQGGVWVFQLSEDLRSIENYYRVGDSPVGDNSDIILVYWETEGESLLVLNGDNFEPAEYLNQLWRAPAVWSLVAEQWENYPR